MKIQYIPLLALIAVFLFIVTFVFGAWLFFDESNFMKRRMVKKRLLYMSSGAWRGQEKFALYRDKMMEDASFLVRLSYALPQRQHLDKMIMAAGLSINPMFIVLASLALIPVGWMIGTFLLKSAMLGLLLAGIGGFSPYLVLQSKIRSRQALFIEQFPESLDLFARSLRAGHAMTSGLSMVSEEMPSPIKDEFGVVVDEINFGLSFDDALLNLCERIPLTDVKFFSVAIMIQRETGGNIADVMNNISQIIRRRVQFKRNVKTLTAEGRMSAIILIGLPILMFGYLYMVNYDYVSLLWREKMGQYMSIAGFILLIVGSFVINKMTDIEG
jgi:tight adherence protein B